MPTSDYECIVLGVGGVGSACLYHLSRRGVRALGIERFLPGHDRGSSHGETRVIRTAYHEHPDYVPLLHRAYSLWHQLEIEAGEQLYWQTGVLEVGPSDGEVVPGVLRAAHEHGLSVSRLSREDVSARFPGFEAPAGTVGVFEEQGGVLAVEACVRAHARLAVAQGAEIWDGTTVHRWRREADRFVVTIDRGEVSANRLIIAGGAWAQGLLNLPDLSLQVLRKPLLWYGATPGSYALAGGSPVFLFELPEGLFYGFPAMEDGEVKLAEHTGGESVDDPRHLDRTLRASDRLPVEVYLQQCMGQVDPRDLRRAAVCMYTMSPDSHFIVGGHPAYPGLAFAAGLSGHGFKFTSVLGEVLTQLVCDGQSALPLGVFTPDRPGCAQEMNLD